MTLQAIFLLPASENCQKPSGPWCRGGPTLGRRTIVVVFLGEELILYVELIVETCSCWIACGNTVEYTVFEEIL